MNGAECRLLTAAARPDPVPAPAVVPVGVDWETTVSLAREHRLLELLGRYVYVTGIRVPDPVGRELRAARWRTATRELLARRQLVEVSSVLAGAGIRSVALKGAGLIDEAYSEPGLRPMVDLDLLVAGDRIDTAAEALSAVGYSPVRDGGERVAGAADAPPTHHHHAPMVHPERAFSVELHRQISSGCGSVSAERTLRRAQAGRRGAYLVPHPNDQAIAVAAHYSLDRQFGSRKALGELADLAHVLARHPPDWRGLVQDIQAYELSARVFLSLDAVNALGIAAVPPDALKALAPPGWNDALSRRILARRVLVDAPARSAAVGVPPTLRQALLPGREFMRARYGLPDASLARLYLERARASTGVMATAVARPVRFMHDVALDRWLRRHEDR